MSYAKYAWLLDQTQHTTIKTATTREIDPIIILIVQKILPAKQVVVPCTEIHIKNQR